MTATPRVRDAAPSDVPELLELIHALAEYERLPDDVTIDADDLGRILFGPEPALRALVSDAPPGHGHALAGTALWFLKFSTWTGRHSVFLDNIYVRTEHRNQGRGRQLLAELAATCVELGHARLEWWVLDWNEPATRFYTRHGSTPMDEWTVHRLSGEPLSALAASARPSPRLTP